MSLIPPATISRPSTVRNLINARKKNDNLPNFNRILQNQFSSSPPTFPRLDTITAGNNSGWSPEWFSFEVNGDLNTFQKIARGKETTNNFSGNFDVQFQYRNHFDALAKKLQSGLFDEEVFTDGSDSNTFRGDNQEFSLDWLRPKQILPRGPRQNFLGFTTDTNDRADPQNITDMSWLSRLHKKKIRWLSDLNRENKPLEKTTLPTAKNNLLNVIKSRMSENGKNLETFLDETLPNETKDT
ncbi:MAG: hypothetical protein ABEJ65_11390 [bacterium]